MLFRSLRDYDAVIIDEDIIFKSVLPNQGEITVSKLEKLLMETTDRRLAKKIKRLLQSAETQSCIELGSFEWGMKKQMTVTNCLYSIYHRSVWQNSFMYAGNQRKQT